MKREEREKQQISPWLLCVDFVKILTLKLLLRIFKIFAHFFFAFLIDLISLTNRWSFAIFIDFKPFVLLSFLFRCWKSILKLLVIYPVNNLITALFNGKNAVNPFQCWERLLLSLKQFVKRKISRSRNWMTHKWDIFSYLLNCGVMSFFFSIVFYLGIFDVWNGKI